MTTAGSLTDWLVRELSRQQGWGSDGIKILALGAMQARLAAIQRGELDGMVIEAATGYELEEAGKAKNFILFGDIAKDFYTHVIFATDDMIDKRPDLLRRFLRGWFKTIAFMKANKDFVVASEARTIDVKPSIAAKIYDAQIGGILARRRLEPGGDRRDQAFAQGARNPSRRAGGEDDLQRQVRAGEVLTRVVLCLNLPMPSWPGLSQAIHVFATRSNA